MLFPSVEFALFFLIVFSFSWAVAEFPTWRKVLLVVASFVFYGWWDARFVWLLLGCTTLNYLFGYGIGRSKDSGRRQLLLTCGIVFNLTTLAFFKYCGFFMANLSSLLHQIGFTTTLRVLEVTLPIGVSFYTFQGISYLVDLYRGEIPVVESPLDMLLFKSFFPQLIAGPIIRAKEFLPQLNEVKLNLRVTRAMLLVCLGLVKKIFFAHYLAQELVNPVFSNPKAFGALDTLLATYGYACQIYCDFSAYTDIASGIALLFGYEFPVNFNQPYRAQSLQEFWRRWHMSLSHFLRDYLYIPLGGSRAGTWRTYRNLMITMVLGGLWHGASWTFIIWGVMHGFGLVIQKAWSNLIPRSQSSSMFAPLAWIFTFHYVCLAWIFFNAESLEHALTLISCFKNWQRGATLLLPFHIMLIGGCIGMQFLPPRALDYLEIKLSHLPLPFQTAAGALLVTIVTAIGPGSLAPFIYFRF